MLVIILYLFTLILDKLWPSDKYGFKFAYAIRLRNGWMVKKPGDSKKVCKSESACFVERVEDVWTKREANWSPSQEQNAWCTYLKVIHFVSCIVIFNLGLYTL